MKFIIKINKNSALTKTKDLFKGGICCEDKPMWIRLTLNKARKIIKYIGNDLKNHYGSDQIEYLKIKKYKD